MNSVRFRCPHCGQMFEGAAEDAGAEAECPSCGKMFRLEPIGVALAARPRGLQCYLGAFKKFAFFSGRARRREFWWAFLFNMIVAFVVGFIDGLMFDEHDGGQYILPGLYTLVSFTPMLALQFRRLHDTGKSGWWWLILPLPVVNLAYLVWLTDDGDKGRNRFGPDPKGR